MARRTNSRAADSYPDIRWFDWRGGRDFLDRGAYVQYRTRDGVICGPSSYSPEWVWDWNIEYPGPTDAVAYRVLPKPQNRLKKGTK